MKHATDISLKPYAGMARYYDLLCQDTVNYEGECDFLQEIFRKHSESTVHSVLDIGCGTGNHAFILAKRGFRVTGIDRSQEMLHFARAKLKRAANPSFFQSDMRRIHVKGIYDAAICMFGGFDYMLRDEEVEGFLRSSRRYLSNGGLLIYEFRQSTGVLPAAGRPQGLRSWSKATDQKRGFLVILLEVSRYDPLTSQLEFDWDFYILDTRKKRLIRHFTESHSTRTYSINQMKKLLSSGGCTPLAFYAIEGEGGKMEPPELSTFRVMCVAKPKIS